MGDEAQTEADASSDGPEYPHYRVNSSGRWTVSAAFFQRAEQLGIQIPEGVHVAEGALTQA